MGDAFTARAVLHRERDNLTREVISVDIKKVLDGTIPDIPLQKMMFYIFPVSMICRIWV